MIFREYIEQQREDRTRLTLISVHCIREQMVGLSLLQG